MPIPTSHSDALLDWEFRGQSAPSLPGTYYAGLLTTAPLANGSGFVEVTGAGYAREAITFAAAAGGAIANSADITFPNATADYPDDVIAIGIFTAASGGSLRRWTRPEDLTPLKVKNTEVYRILAGTLRLVNLNSW